MKTITILTTIIMLLCLSSITYAQGIIIPRPPHRPFTPIYLKKHHVNVTINNQAATTKIDQVFANDNQAVLEGTYIFPLPDDASVSDFAMYVDGKKLDGELLAKDKARRIYEDIVRKQRDPALLEYIGQRAFQARIYPIPAKGEKRIQLEYSQALKLDDGIVRYSYPLNTEKFANKPIQDVAINISIESKQPIKSVYCPAFDAEVVRKNDNEAKVGYEGSNVRPNRDFICYYTLSKKDFGIDLIALRDDDEDGFFMLLISPKQDVDESEIINKDIIFVLDKSGSMRGKKIEQAKDALSFCVKGLNDQDRFNIVTFSTEVETFSDELLEATAANRDKASSFIKAIKNTGGTNINEALLTALKDEPTPERPRMIVFLTDGKPTVGETDIKDILDNVKKTNKSVARIFVFGVGYDVNTHLLDKLAEGNQGTPQYVEPQEDIEVAVSSFFTKVSNPVLANLELDTGKAKTKEIYPRTLPDLFRGSQLVVLGRYEGHVDTAVMLTGEINGKKRRFANDITFPKSETKNDFLPRLWAQRKVAYLLDEIRLHGENKELKDEIVRLSKKHGIMTPYTSFLVQEDEMPAVATAPRSPRRLSERRGRGGANGRGEAELSATPESTTAGDFYSSSYMRSGKPAVERAKKLAELKRADGLASQYEESAEQQTTIKRVGRKTFYLKDDFWTDSEYEEKMKVIEIEYGSDKYFDLLAKNKELKKYLAIGTKVIVCYKSKCYRIK